MIGKRLGRYVVKARAGAGGMGEVYLATDTQLDRPVALKVLPSELSENPARRARLLREARLAASLSHPHVATVHEVFEYEGMLVLAMEYVEGESLRRRLTAGPLPLRQVLRIGAQIADALSAAHRRGVVHRDIKPDNVMITPDGLVKVLDFGLARALEPPAAGDGEERTRTATPQLSGAGQVIGTPGYLAPEQARGHPAQPETDVFALGVTLYEAATGRRPFVADSTAGVIAAILRDQPAPPSSLNAEIPPEFDRILARAMAKDAAERYRDARDMASDLRELRRRIESADSADSLTAARPARRGPWRVLAGVAAVLVLAAASLFAWRIAHRDRAPREAPPAGRLRILLSTDGQVEGVSLSRDGKMIAYAAEEGGRVDLFVSRTGGGGRVRLTDDLARDEDPSFSPDGDRLAFTRWNPETREPEVRTVPTLGGETRLILKNAAQPAWSPDGSRLACVSRRPDGQSGLVTMASDGSEVRELLAASADYPFLRSVSWSPDGTLLAMDRSQGGAAGEILLVPTAGGPSRRAFQDPPGVSSHTPVFTGNGRSLVYSSNRSGARNLWRVPIDPPGEPTRLTSGPGPDLRPAVSADGRIAFINERSRAALIVLRLDTGEVREVLRGSGSIWAPSFSPNGREIAYSRGEANGEWHVWIVPTEGGPARQLTSSGLGELYPRFTADGATVVFNHWTPGPDRIWRVSRAGGPPVAVTPARDGDDAYADVSPDGKRIAFARTEGGTDRVFAMDLEGGEARALVDVPSTVPSWSPDGALIAYAPDRRLEGAIRVVRPDGSGARVVAPLGGWPFWLADGKRLAYLAVGTDGNAEIRVVRIDGGGPPERIEGIHFRGTNYPCRASRDGKFLVTSNSVDVTSDVWLLEP